MALVSLGAYWALQPARHVLRLKIQASDVGELAVARQVDATFETEWNAKGMNPAAVADSDIQVRRLALALVGSVPSLESLRALEGLPEEARVRSYLDLLLEDDRFHDYFAERLARAWVGVENGPFLVYRRRRLVSWISESLAENRSYRELVSRLIAAEGVWTSNPEVNFLTVTIDQNDKENKGPDEIKLAARVSRAFLGVRLDCVQCHDDKFGDRWKQTDFHQLAAFFAGAEVKLNGVRDQEEEYLYRYLGKDEAELVPARVPFGESWLPKQGEPRERLAEWVTHPDNRAFPRAAVNRVWALMFNRPLVDPIDDLPVDGPIPPAMDLLAEDFAFHGYDLRRLIRVIAATRVFALESRLPDNPGADWVEHQAAWASFPLTRLRPEQVAGGILQASHLGALNADSHILQKVMKATSIQGFLKRYGDLGEDEFEAAGGTIPQRLLLMNGNMVHERTKENPVMNASTRIGILAGGDREAIRAASLAVLTREPTEAELHEFQSWFQEAGKKRRGTVMADIYWSLLNSTEFSWNH